MNLPQAMSRSVVLMLGCCVALNFIDRSSLATAAPLIQKEFDLTSAELGLLLSAFFWVYTPAQMLGGWLVHRFNVRWVLGIGVLVWGCATALMGLAGGFVTIFILRCLLALGECVTFPSIQLIANRNSRIEERGRVTSLISSGQGFGPFVGTLFGGLAMATFGWRAMFVCLGVTTALWVFPWHVVSRARLRVEPEYQSSFQVPYLEILRRREFWGMTLGMFAGNYTFYFLFIWLPSYLVEVGGFSIKGMAKSVASIYGVYALMVVFTGQMADRLTARGSSATRVWKSIVVISYTGLLVSVACCAFVHPRMAVWLLGLAAVFCGMTTSSLYAMTATLPGPRAGGRWAGAQSVAGQLAGIVSPIVTGLLIDRTGNYKQAFLLAAAGAAVAMFAWCVLVRRVEAVDWDVRCANCPAQETSKAL